MIHWLSIFRETKEHHFGNFKKVLVARFEITLKLLIWFLSSIKNYKMSNVQGTSLVDFNRTSSTRFIVSISNPTFKPNSRDIEELTESHVDSRLYRGQNSNWQQNNVGLLAKGVISSGWKFNTRGASLKSHGGWSNGQNQSNYMSSLDNSF